MTTTTAPKITKSKFIFFTIFTLWVAAKYTIPAFQSGHMDAMMWNHHGLGWLQILLSLVSLPLLYASLYLYERKMKPGYIIANLYIAISIITTAIGTFLYKQSTHLVAEWYTKSRELRGFPISNEKAIAATSSAIVDIMPMLIIAFFVVVAIILYKKRHHYVFDFNLVGFIKN